MLKCVEKARKALQAHLKPSMIYIVEHCRQKCAVELFWHVLEVSREGAHLVKQFKVIVGSVNVEIDKRHLGGFSHEFQAKKRIEQEITCLEQNDCVFVEEHTRALLDIKHVAQQCSGTTRNQVLSLSEFQAKHSVGSVDIMPIPSGILVQIIVDEYADVWMRYRASKYADAWFRPSESLRSIFCRSIQHMRAKGFIGDGYFDGRRIFISDVYYVLDRNLAHKSSRKRNELAERLNIHFNFKIPLLRYRQCSIAALGSVFNDVVFGIQVADTQDHAFTLGREQVGEIFFGMSSKERKSKGTDDQCRDLGWFDVSHLPCIEFTTFQLLRLKNSGAGKEFLAV